MATSHTSDTTPPGLWAGLDHAPFPMATVEGAMHTVRYINPAFCHMIDKTGAELVGKPFASMLPGMDGCLALLDRVYRTGKSECYTEQTPSALHSSTSSYMMWPLMADERPVGVMIQVIGTSPLREDTLAMNEALMLGSLRQHELTAAADAANIHLQAEMLLQKEREHDAQMMTRELAHRIKNNLQIVVSLIGYEARRAAAPCVEGYTTIQSRIVAIAELYDLMSRSAQGRVVPVGAYLGEIAIALSSSLLGGDSGIKIDVDADAVDIDPDRAVSLGLVVNELVTNAVKHAFPGGTGRILLRVERTGDQIELAIVDNGVGLKDQSPVPNAEQHGSDYVAMFVRQLQGTIAVSASGGSGTDVRIRLPLLAS